MTTSENQCTPGNNSAYTLIFSNISKVDENDNIYIDDFKAKIKEYSINDNYNIMNIIIINILFNAIEIFNIKDYENNYKLHYKLYNNINYLLNKINNLTNIDIDIDSLIMSDIKSYISSYIYFEKCLAKDILKKEAELKTENIIEEINNLNAKSKGVKEINIHLIAIEKSLNIIKYQPKIKEFKDIITKYITKDITIDDNNKIEDYCSNIILLMNKINNNQINEKFKELINTPKIIEGKKVKETSLSTMFSKLNFSGKTNQSTIYNTDNYFIMFYKNILEIYKNILEIYKNEQKCVYNNETDKCINIKKLLFYIAKLYHISKKLNEDIITYDDEPPNIDTLNVFLAIKFGGKNKNEFINYKFENKVYRRKVRYDGKKKYIILDKTRIYIKK